MRWPWRRRLRVWRWVCACGFRKRETCVQASTIDCPYCFREVTPERLP